VKESQKTMENYNEELKKSNIESMESVKQSIINGEIYAHIESVAKSGMSRRILFFRVDMPKDGENNLYFQIPRIKNITPQIAWLYKSVEVGEYKQGGKWLDESGLKVSGCGMDMVFHTLYRCLDYETEGKQWNQSYKLL
jgi:hypothetical protein